MAPPGCMIFIALILVSGVVNALELFVCGSTGSDTNNGTLNFPLATLNGARLAVKQYRFSSKFDNSTANKISIRGGSYALWNSSLPQWVFDSTDSGFDAQHATTYQAYGPESVYLMGGIQLPLSCWSTVSDTLHPAYNSRLAQITLGVVQACRLASLGLSGARLGTLLGRGFGTSGTSAAELFHDQKPFELARWPNIKQIITGTVATPPGFAATSAPVTPLTFHFAFNDSKNVIRPRPNVADSWVGTAASADLWLHGYLTYAWADYHVKVNYNATTQNMTLANIIPYGVTAGSPFYVENMLEELDQEGEYYIDRSGVDAYVYIWPVPGTQRITLSLATQPLLKMTGTSQSKVQFVTFRNLNFEMGWTSMVSVTQAVGVTFLNCSFMDAGSLAISITSSYQTGLDQGEVGYSGAGGVAMDGGVRSSLTPSLNYVRNMYIHDFGRFVTTYTPAVLVSGVAINVSNCHMAYAPHTAILYSGNNHIFEYNEIHNVVRGTSDAGAIYGGRDWAGFGTVIRFNYIYNIATDGIGYGSHAIYLDDCLSGITVFVSCKIVHSQHKLYIYTGYGSHAIYLDDCLSGITVFGNLLVNISGLGIQHGGGNNNNMNNNVMVNCGTAFAPDNRGSSWGLIKADGSSWDMLLKMNNLKYQQPPWSVAFPELARIPNNYTIIQNISSCIPSERPSQCWLQPYGCSFQNNIGYINKVNISSKQLLVYFDTSLPNFWNDPHFEDISHGDFRLRADSPVFITMPGFQPLPLEQIGLGGNTPIVPTLAPTSAPTLAPATTTPPIASGGSTVGVIVGLVLGVVLAGAAVGLYVRRHRSNSTKTSTAFVDLDQVNSKPLDNLGGVAQGQPQFMTTTNQLPPGWTQHCDPAGTTYYYNSATNKSSWTLPTY